MQKDSVAKTIPCGSSGDSPSPGMPFCAGIPDTGSGTSASFLCGTVDAQFSRDIFFVRPFTSYYTISFFGGTGRSASVFPYRVVDVKGLSGCAAVLFLRVYERERAMLRLEITDVAVIERERDWLSTGETASLLGVSSKTIGRWRKAGVVRASRPYAQGNWRYPIRDVKALWEGLSGDDL